MELERGEGEVMCERKMGTDLKGSEVERNGGSVNSEGKKGEKQGLK